MNIKELFKRLSATVAAMTPSQVMVLFGAIAGIIVGMVLVIGWATNISYATLYSGLDEAEAGDVTTYLSENKIPFRLANGGTAIEVPSSEVYRTRISLAAEGLPKSGTVGYSIFDKNNLGMTDFLQNLNYRRALEGELTKTIMQISEVQAARVHIVIPKDRLFKEDKKEPTASVLLKLRGHSQLSRPQINGITHLMASSVEGLSPQNISIVDYNGNLLSGGQKQDPLAGMSSSQLEVRQSVESYLEQKAQSLLDGVLGGGKSLVRVTADLNFSQVEKTSENFDPDVSVIRSEERTKNGTSETNADGTGTSESNETNITNYELNKSVEHIVNAVGTINRLTVALMVDGTYTDQTGEGGAVEKVYQPRSQEELDQLAAVVRTAVGFDSERTDQLEIYSVPFDRTALEVEQQQLDTMYTRQFYWDIVRQVAPFLIIIVAFLLLRRTIGKIFGAVKQTLASLPVNQSRTAAAEVRHEEIKPIAVEHQRPRLVDVMQKTAKDRPDEVAKVIKTLLVE